MTVHRGHLPTQLNQGVSPDRIFRLTVAKYHEMIDRAILTEADPVELVEGWLVTKMPKNPPHVTAADLTADKLNDLKPSGWSVRRQDPITTGDSEPDPDVVLARGSRRDFETRHPGPSEVALLVEVADSTSGPGATPDYRRATVHRESEGVSLVVNDRELGPIAVRDLLPSVTTD